MIQQQFPSESEKTFLNVAAVCTGTKALGPGLRSVVWTQGCVFRCPGCNSPDWIPVRPARLVSPEDLVDELLANPQVSGLTFSGGEPMLQAIGLARLAHLARQKRDLSIICFTGFTLDQLNSNPPGPGIDNLLAQVDILIDGPYIARLDDNRGMRGSANQHIYHLTDRLADFDLENYPRKAEIRIQDGQAMFVGVPPAGLVQAFRSALDTANRLQWEMLHERV